MRVLFYNHTGQVSGAERLLLMILERLDRRGFLPLALCPGNGPLLRMLSDLDVAAAAVESLDARFTLRGDHLIRYLTSVYRVALELRRKIVALKPDLIHANSIRAGLVATVATAGLEIRVIWHLHDLLPRHPLSSAIRIFAVLFTRTRMVAVSQAVADNFVGSFFPLKNRVSVILNAIDLTRFQTTQTNPHSIREELLLNDARPLIGIVGQLTPRKGQLELIRAFAKFVKEMPQAMLVVVGAPLFNRDEEYADQLKKTVQELGIGDRVRITSARNDVAAVMQSLDLLVVNSSVEPFGLVVLEAMACGTPVLAAASGGVSEIIDHGRNGWLIPPGNEQELSNSLLKLAGDPDLLFKLAEQGRTRVASRFSVDRYLRDLMEFYGSGGELRSRVVDDHRRSSPDRNLHERARLELS